MTIPKVNLGLIFILFVLFAGMTFAAPDYTISECGRFANPGLYELTGDINTGYINTTFEDPTDHGMCDGNYSAWQTCISDPVFDPDVNNCTIEAAAYEACIDLNGYQDPQTACLQFRAIGGLGSQSIVLDCKGHKITTDVDYGILVYEPFAVLRYGGEGSYWTSISQNVEIRNCYVENSQTGAITLIDVRNTNITNNTVINNAPTETFAAGNILGCSGGITLLNSFYSEVTNNTAINNTFGICVARSTPRDTIYDPFSRENRIYDNIAYNNRFTGFGIAGGSYDNNVTDNTFTNNTYGLIIGAAFNNTFRDLNVSNNKYIDFAGDPIFYSDYFCNNSIDGSHKDYIGSINITGGEKLYFYNESVTLIGDGVTRTLPTSEIIVCADNVNVSNFVLQGIPSKRNNGLFVMGDNLKVNGLDASNVMVGLYTQLSDNIIIQNSTFRNNKNGIMLNSVTNVDISNNNFEDNTATGIVGSTSPGLFLGGPYPMLSYIDIYDNTFLRSGDGTSIKDAYPGVFDLMGIKLHPGDFLDLGTGSATSLFFAHNVTYYDNVINQSSTYGFAGVLVSDSEIYENEITNILGTTAYEITSGGFFEVMHLDEMLAFLPGTGIVFDGSLTNITSNNMSSSINGFISLPFTNMFSGFGLSLMPPGPNYVYGNEIFDNTLVGFGLIGPTVFHSNLVYDNNYTFAISEGSYVFNNFFNNTNEIFSIEADAPNYFNITLTAGTNIIGGDTLGGNFWGKSDGLGYSQYCDDLDDNGICDIPNPLTGNLVSSNNTDYFPLALTSGAPPPGPDECIDLDDVKNPLKAPDGNITNEYGDVRYYDGTFYINNDTSLCPNTYYTEVDTDVFIYMNGSYKLYCNQPLISDYAMVSLSSNAIGILNHNSDVRIEGCRFKDFIEGVVSTPDPTTSEVEEAVGINLFNSLIEVESGSVNTLDPIESAFNDLYLNTHLSGVAKFDNKLFTSLYIYPYNFYSADDYSEIYSSEYDYSDENYFTPLENECGVILYNNNNISKVLCDGTVQWTKTFSEREVEVCEISWETVLENGNPLGDPTITLNGSKMFVSYYDGSETYLYMSTDSDYSVWTPIYGPLGNPNGFSTSRNGDKLLLSHYNYTDSLHRLTYFDGTGWIDLLDSSTLINGHITKFDMSDDGKKLFVYIYNNTFNDMYKCDLAFSTCVGWENWTKINEVSGIYNYNGEFDVSGDGNVIVINLENNNSFYYSNDGGTNWELRTYPPDLTLISANTKLFLPYNGALMFAVLSDGYLYKHRSDYFNDWISTGLYIGQEMYTQVALTADGEGYGSNVIAGNKTNIFLSDNFGWSGTYDEISSGSSYHGVGISDNGKMIVDGNAGLYFINLSSEVCHNEIEAVDVVAYALQHPITSNIYSYSIGSDDTGFYGRIAAYNVTTGDELWKTTLLEADMKKGTFIFDENGNLVVLYNNATIGTYLVKLNYSTGEEITYEGGVRAEYPGNYIKDNNYPYMFIDTDGYIYDFSMYAPSADSPVSYGYIHKYKADGTNYSNITFEVPYVRTRFSEYSYDKYVNMLFDGEYIYYTAEDSLTGTQRLYYKVFNLSLEEVASGEFKPTYQSVTFSSYLNEEGNVEFLGTARIVGTEQNFLAYLNKSNEFEFTVVYPSDYEGENLIADDLRFVEIDSLNNSVIVGMSRGPRVSSIKLLKYDSEGNELLNEVYSDELTNTVPMNFILTSDENYLVGGYYLNGSEHTYFLMLINGSDGEVLNTLSMDSSDYATFGLDLFETDDGYYAMTYNDSFSSVMNFINSTFMVNLSMEIGTRVLDVSQNDNFICMATYNSGDSKTNLNLINKSNLGPAGTIMNVRPEEGVTYYAVDRAFTEIDENNNCYYINPEYDGYQSRILGYNMSGDNFIDKTISDHTVYSLGFSDSLIYVLLEGDDLDGILTMNYSGGNQNVLLNKNNLLYYPGFKYKDGLMTLYSNDGSYINDIHHYNNFIEHYNESNELVWSKNYLMDLNGDIVDTTSMVIQIIEMDSNTYIGSVMNMEVSDFSNEIMGSTASFYKVTSTGVVTKWFDFNEPFMFPSNMKYINGKLYVLMGSLEDFGFDPDSFFSGRYYLYVFNNDGSYNIIDIPEMYTVSNMMAYKGIMSYDSTGYLLIGGSSLGPYNDDMGVNLLPTYNLTKVRISDGQIMWNNEMPLPYEGSPLNWVREVHVVDDGYLIVMGGVAPSFIFSFIVKTDFDGAVQSLQPLIDGTYGVECTGGWDELEGMKTDTSIRISKDGSKLYYVYDNKLYSYDVASSIPSVIVPTWVNSKHGFDMSTDGSVMLVAIEEFPGKYTWYHANNLTNPENWTIVEGFDNITTGSGYSLVSSNGTTMVIGFDNGTIYRSENGTSGPWVKKLDLPEGSYGTPFMSGDGETIIISYSLESKYLNISTDGGDTWGTSLWESLPDGFTVIEEFKINEDGSKLLTLLTKGSEESAEYALYLYNISGETWEEIGDELSFDRVSFSYMGDSASSKILVTSPGYKTSRLYLSEDDGITWNETHPAGNSAYPWDSVDMSLDGKMIVGYTEWVEGVPTQYIFLSNGDEEVCSEGIFGDFYEGLPLGSYMMEGVPGDNFFTTITDFNSFSTLFVTGETGEVLEEIEIPFLRGYNTDNGFHLLSFDLGGAMGYLKVNKDLFMIYGMDGSGEIQAMIPTTDVYAMDFQPTSYGVILAGSYDNNPAFMGYSFKKTYDSSLTNVNVEDIGIFKTGESLLIDLTSGGADVENLAVGCSDFSCMVTFFGINNADGFLRLGQNIWWGTGNFMSIDSSDLNANVFNTISRVKLSYTGPTPTSVVGSNEPCTTRQCVLDTGVNLTGIDLTCDTVKKYCEFEVSGWSSYTLGSVPGPDPDPKDDMRLIYNSEMCIGETYAINVWDKFDDPIKNALVTIHYPDGDSMESRTKLEGNILFTPQLEGVYRLDAQGPSGYDDIKLSANHQFTARDCSLSGVCPDPTKENYTLVVDNPPFDCQYACSITECPNGFDLVDDSLGCRCALLICPEPDENYKFVINDPPTCTYECAIDQAYCDTLGEDYTFNESSCNCDSSGVIIIVIPEYEPDPNKFDLKEGQVCTGGAFTFDVISGSADFLLNAMVSVFDENGVKIYENVDLSELQPLYSNGTYTFVVSSPGYKTSRLSVEIVDCPEPDIEEPIITPVESSFWDDIINILRTSIKGGCEGFYFEGLPTILCDLVWVVVIVGSVGAAYLEPLKSRKVISLFTPSVVAIVLIPLMGAIAAAVVVYLAYNSKKHVEGKLGHEKEQMEAEIQK